MQYAIKAKMLIDGTGGAPLENAVVLVDGGTITAVGKEPEVNVPPAFQVIDASDKTLMPGMIDAHVHLQGSGDPAERTAGENSITAAGPARLALRALKNAQSSMKAGFTTLRNCATEFWADVDVRDAINRGDVIGPRIWACGPGLTATSGHMDRAKEFPHHVKLDLPLSLCDDPYAARKAVMMNLTHNVDHIKINASIGVLSKILPEGHPVICAPEMTQDTFQALMEQAHWHGRKVTAHVHGGDAVRWAIESGLDGVEHGSFLEDSHLELMAEKGTVYCPTLSVIGNTLKDGNLDFYSGASRTFYQRADKTVWEITSKARKLGIKCIVGTDASWAFCYHGGNATELAYLVDCGFTPMEAITAATGGAAEALGIPGIGFVQAGKFADLVLFDGNPLKDIKSLQNLDKIVMVMVNGKIVADKFTNIK